MCDCVTRALSQEWDHDWKYGFSDSWLVLFSLLGRSNTAHTHAHTDRLSNKHWAVENNSLLSCSCSASAVARCVFSSLMICRWGSGWHFYMTDCRCGAWLRVNNVLRGAVRRHWPFSTDSEVIAWTWVSGVFQGVGHLMASSHEWHMICLEFLCDMGWQPYLQIASQLVITCCIRFHIAAVCWRLDSNRSGPQWLTWHESNTGPLLCSLRSGDWLFDDSTHPRQLHRRPCDSSQRISYYYVQVGALWEYVCAFQHGLLNNLYCKFILTVFITCKYTINNLQDRSFVLIPTQHSLYFSIKSPLSVRRLELCGKYINIGALKENSLLTWWADSPR